MNFYQIHIPVNNNFPKKRIKYINSVLKQLKIEDEYYLVSTENFLENDNVNLIDINLVQNQLFQRHPYFQECWDKLHVTNQADLIRFYLLSKTIDMLYLDTDVQLKKYPIINKNNELPSFSHSTRFKFCIDFNLIYNNNNFQWFAEYLRRVEVVLKGNELHNKKEELDITVLWKMLKKYSREFNYNQFSDDFYIHHNLMGK